MYESDDGDEYKAQFPLHYDVITGKVAHVITELTLNPERLNHRDEDGATPLHYAAASFGEEDDNQQIMDYLLKAGIQNSINTKDNMGETPLHYAAKALNLVAVNFLLQQGADPLLKNNNEETPLDLAQHTQKNYAKEVLYTSSFGTEITDIYSLASKVTNSLLSVERAKREDQEKKQQQATDELFLLFRSNTASHKKIDALIKKGADINGVISENKSCHKGKRILTYLVELYLHQKTLNSKKAKYRLKMIEEVINYGADPYKQDNRGNSAMSIIEDMKQGSYKTNLNDAIQNCLNKRQSNNPSDMQPGTNMEAEKQQATNELFILFTLGNPAHKKINELIKKGADINGVIFKNKSDHNGKNILTYLVERYSRQEDASCYNAYHVRNMIGKVIAHGADPNRKDDHGNSAMSLIEDMKQDSYKTNLNNEIQKALAKRQSNKRCCEQHEESSSSSKKRKLDEWPDTNKDVIDLEQPSTSRGHGAVGKAFN